MSRNWPFIVLAIIVGFVLVGASCAFGAVLGAALAVGGGAPGFAAGDAVAIIPVQGTIQTGESPGGLFDTGGAYSGTIRNLLRRAQEDVSVKAVILRIDSPGGGVTASEEIYDEVIRTQREFNKKVVVSMESMAASGGYYISAPADRIVAYKSTLTGSIGVISIVPDIQGLLDMVGVKMIIFKSGAHKDDLSGFRPLTPEDEAIQQGIINETYNQFVDVVAAGREMDRQTVVKLADGRVYTGMQAKGNGLVDELGNMEDAIHIAAELAGIKGQPRVVEYRRRGLFSSVYETFFGPTPQISLKQLLGIDGLSGLQYLYIPSVGDK